MTPPVYIVTRSAAYYPEAGTGDWLLADADLSEATEVYERELTMAAERKAAGEYQTYASVYLIEVNPSDSERMWNVLRSDALDDGVDA